MSPESGREAAAPTSLGRAFRAILGAPALWAILVAVVTAVLLVDDAAFRIAAALAAGLCSRLAIGKRITRLNQDRS